MLNKRIVAVVTIKSGWAVQSFGYSSYLPIGKPEVLIENLDRWGADEIVVNVIDASLKQKGPDFELIEKIGNLSASTPIIYGGGIRHEPDAIEVIKKGADRITINSILFNNPKSVCKIADSLGSQAIIASLPLINVNNTVKHFNYISRKSCNLSKEITSLINEKVISEVMITDTLNEGSFNGFDTRLLKINELKKTKIIAFGGLADTSIGEKVISMNNVSAVAVGNSFAYREHAIQSYNKKIKSKNLRAAYFRDEKNYDWNE